MRKKRDIAILGRAGVRGGAPAPVPVPVQAPCTACLGDGRISVHSADTGATEIRACFGCGGTGKAR